ncbi:hypothetical protein CVS30_09060 [Arthrobacter psychrolactophilus]|uniref:Uncharacterized protein n=1 Tax=Arthrobacter psychrolactophilus TaxID=92442 RepID=A0A2V5IWR9_9MICC|nr:hypothetical protein [Arthrobacter psychrolactophilus]PYI38694.1 hypothetical protein CVS30_09060 [Arthrobacter psychrolactophilus]
MTTEFPSAPTQVFQDVSVSPLECITCHSSDHLTIDSIHGLHPKVRGRVAVEYKCILCGTTHLCDAAVEAVARILANIPTATGVLKIGRDYIHCGEPMQHLSQQRLKLKVQDPFVEEESVIDAPVLRCHCGFQLALPPPHPNR